MVHLLYAFNDDILFEVDPSTCNVTFSDLTLNQSLISTDVGTQSDAMDLQLKVTNTHPLVSSSHDFIHYFNFCFWSLNSRWSMPQLNLSSNGVIRMNSIYGYN